MLGRKIIEYYTAKMPESKPSLLYYEGDKMMIGKVVNGEWRVEEGIKDPNYNGNRYIWKSEICETVKE